MNLKQKKRLVAIVSVIILLSAATGLILYALKQNINLFYTPTELLQAHVDSKQHIRLGGYVKNNSIRFDAKGLSVSFVVTDRVKEMTVHYQGVLPNLFREGQAIVATGILHNHNELLAHEILAKHDEKYMPQSLKRSLKKDGNDVG